MKCYIFVKKKDKIGLLYRCFPVNFVMLLKAGILITHVNDSYQSGLMNV